MVKKALISGYYGFDNFGDEAILAVLIKNLKNIGIDVTVFSTNPQKTISNYAVKSVYTFSFKSIFSELKNTDFLISGGGSLLQDATSLKSLIYYLFVIKMAQIFRKKIIIFAQGIGPLNNKFFRFLTKLILKKCHLVTVRDEKSLFLLRGWGINVHLVEDPIWGIELPNYNPQKKVGVQLRSWHSLSDDFLMALAWQLKNKFLDYEICILPFQKTIDYDVCLKFKKMCELISPHSKIFLSEAENNQDIIKEISELEYLIAMRFHAVLVAAKLGVKTLAINYDIKVRNLAEALSLPNLDLGDIKDIPQKVDNILDINLEILKGKTQAKNFDFNLYHTFLKK